MPLVVVSGLSIAGVDLWAMILVIALVATALLFVFEYFFATVRERGTDEERNAAVDPKPSRQLAPTRYSLSRGSSDDTRLRHAWRRWRFHAAKGAPPRRLLPPSLLSPAARVWASCSASSPALSPPG